VGTWFLHLPPQRAVHTPAPCQLRHWQLWIKWWTSSVLTLRLKQSAAYHFWKPYYDASRLPLWRNMDRFIFTRVRNLCCALHERPVLLCEGYLLGLSYFRKLHSQSRMKTRHMSTDQSGYTSFRSTRFGLANNKPQQLVLMTTTYMSEKGFSYLVEFMGVGSEAEGPWNPGILKFDILLLMFLVRNAFPWLLSWSNEISAWFAPLGKNPSDARNRAEK